MAVVVSACLMGENCKYNGGSNRCQRVIDFLEGKEVIPVCPERRCGMPSPRPPVEICGGKMVDVHGRDVDSLYRQGVADTLKDLAGREIELAILQPRSPTCGVKQVYDGSFSGTLIPGKGALSQALAEMGVPLLEPEDLP